MKLSSVKATLAALTATFAMANNSTVENVLEEPKLPQGFATEASERLANDGRFQDELEKMMEDGEVKARGKSGSGGDEMRLETKKMLRGESHENVEEVAEQKPAEVDSGMEKQLKEVKNEGVVTEVKEREKDGEQPSVSEDYPPQIQNGSVAEEDWNVTTLRSQVSEKEEPELVEMGKSSELGQNGTTSNEIPSDLQQVYEKKNGINHTDMDFSNGPSEKLSRVESTESDTPFSEEKSAESDTPSSEVNSHINHSEIGQTSSNTTGKVNFSGKSNVTNGLTNSSLDVNNRSPPLEMKQFDTNEIDANRDSDSGLVGKEESDSDTESSDDENDELAKDTALKKKGAEVDSKLRDSEGSKTEYEEKNTTSDSELEKTESGSDDKGHVSEVKEFKSGSEENKEASFEDETEPDLKETDSGETDSKGEKDVEKEGDSKEEETDSKEVETDHEKEETKSKEKKTEIAKKGNESDFYDEENQQQKVVSHKGFDEEKDGSSLANSKQKKNGDIAEDVRDSKHSTETGAEEENGTVKEDSDVSESSKIVRGNQKKNTDVDQENTDESDSLDKKPTEDGLSEQDYGEDYPSGADHKTFPQNDGSDEDDSENDGGNFNLEDSDWDSHGKPAEEEYPSKHKTTPSPQVKVSNPNSDTSLYDEDDFYKPDTPQSKTKKPTLFTPSFDYDEVGTISSKEDDSIEENDYAEVHGGNNAGYNTPERVYHPEVSYAAGMVPMVFLIICSGLCFFGGRKLVSISDDGYVPIAQEEYSGRRKSFSFGNRSKATNGLPITPDVVRLN